MDKLEERNERMEERKDLRSEHTTVRQNAQRQMEGLIDDVKTPIQTFGEWRWIGEDREDRKAPPGRCGGFEAVLQTKTRHMWFLAWQSILKPI